MEKEKIELKTKCDFTDGVKVIADFRDDCNPIEGELLLKDGTWFLLNNKHDGNSCGADKRGFKYSWSLGTSWESGDQGIRHLYLSDSKDRSTPKIQEASKLCWEKFTKMLKDVEIYGKNLESIDEVEAFMKQVQKSMK